MAITYHTGSLAARLKLMAISQRYGKVIREGLSWSIQEQGKKLSQPIESKEATPVLALHPGHYEVTVTHLDQVVVMPPIELEQNAERQALVLIADAAFDPYSEYVVSDTEFDPFNNHDRRALERDGQRQFAVADGPTRDPYAKSTGDVGLSAHPLLQDSVQFDGADVNMTPTTDNEQAVQKTFELQHQLNPTPAMNPVDTFNPDRGPR